MVLGKGPTLAARTTEGIQELLASADAALLIGARLYQADTQVLVIFPNGTRTAPIPLFFRLLYEQVGRGVAQLDYLIALGTHQPLSPAAIDHLIGATAAERAASYPNVHIFNHAWDDLQVHQTADLIPCSEAAELTRGLLAADVPVTLNRLVFDYDLVLVCSLVFPHEGAGFSGGAIYLFPGIAGPDIINFTHWLGILVTNSGRAHLLTAYVFRRKQVMGEREFVDAHVHLWNPQHFRMPWVDDAPALNKPFGLADYPRQSADRTIDALVYVEVDVAPHYSLLEARWAADQAMHDTRLQGIVAAAPVEYGEQVRAYLDALQATSPLIKGGRRNLQNEQDSAFCLQDDFVQGVRLLPAYGFSFDLCIRHWQLPAVVDLVRRCPDTQFILDHLGKPAIKAQVLDPWREQLAQLAALPNVWCKVSGLVTEADHQGWIPEDLAPYITHAMEVFGQDRIIFGGDWPVLLLAASHDRWVETLEGLTQHLSPEAQRKLWKENACQFYRL